MDGLVCVKVTYIYIYMHNIYMVMTQCKPHLLSCLYSSLPCYILNVGCFGLILGESQIY